MTVPNSTPTRRRPQLSLTVQTLLIAAGSLLLLGVVTVFGAALVVNSLKDRLVEEAKTQAREAGAEAAKQIGRVMAEMKARRLEEIAAHPEVRTQLRVLSREGSVVMSAIVDPEGGVLMQQFGDLDGTRAIPPGTATRFGGMLPEMKDLTWELNVTPIPPSAENERVPIVAGNETVGFLEYELSATAATQRLEDLSSQISTNLIVMVAAVAALLGVTVFLLVRIFYRHLALAREKAEAQHLAHIGTLASGLAHEIRNPLHAMNLHLEVVKEELEALSAANGAAPPTQQSVVTLQRSISALNATVTNFMKYAMPGKLDLEPVRLEVLLAEIAVLVKPEYESRGVKLHTELAQNAVVRGDQTALRQVFLNVLLNAAQILDGRERREVFLTLAPAKGGWEAIVEDTGPGIPQGEEQRIFEAFVSHRKGGSGFGLAIARRIVDEHGGEITAAQSDRAGGAAFRIRLLGG